MHSEHIFGAKVLIPMGGGGSGKCTLEHIAYTCGGVSMHSEHIVATRVLMPMGGVQESALLSTLLLQKCSCPWGVSVKVHSEHIVATKVLMPVGWVGVQDQTRGSFQGFVKGLI